MTAQQPVTADQRRHIRYQIPLKCLVDGVSYDVHDWSVAGFGFRGSQRSYVPGDIVRTQLLFPFNEYSLVMTVDCEVRNFEAATGRVGASFLPPNEKQTNVLRYLIDAYIAGDIVDVGDVIEISARRNEGVARSIPTVDSKTTPIARLGQSLGQGLRVAFFALLAVGLITYVAIGVYARVYVHPAMAAVIDVDTLELGATATGSLTYLDKTLVRDSKVKKGADLLKIEDRTGAVVTIKSPCDCTVVSVDRSDGGFTAEGDTLLRLVPVDAKPYIRATLDAETLLAAQRDSIATLEYSDGRKVSVSLAGNPPKPIVLPQSGRVSIGTDVPLPAGRDDLKLDRIGEAVRVTIDGSGSSAVGKLLRMVRS